MKKLLTIGYIILTTFLSTHAQHAGFLMDSLTIEHGLASNGIKSILKDSRGFMWFGTNNGLNRYDGYNFKTYKFDVADPLSLSNNRIYDLFEDREGNLWVATANGLNKFDRDKEIFIHYFSDPNNNKTLSSNITISVFEDRSGVLWVGTYDHGLNRFDKESEIFHRYKYDPGNPNSLSGNRINVLYEDKKGELWIGAWPGGLSRYDKGNDTFQRFLIDTVNTMSDINKITDIYEDRYGNFWVSTWCGLYKFDRNKKIFTRYLHESQNPNSPDDQCIIAFREENSGNYWLRTLEGVYLYSSDLKRLNVWKHKPSRKLFSTYKNSGLFIDESNMLWYSQNYQGIHKLSEYNKRFRKINSFPVNENKYLVRAIFVENNDVIWLGDRNGLTRINRKNNKYDLYQLYPEKSEINKNNTIYDILRDSDSTLWVGMINGLNRVEITTKNRAKFTTFNINKDIHKNETSLDVLRIFENKKGELFVASSDYMYIFDIEKECFIQITDSLNKPLFSSIIYKGKNGGLWLCSRLYGLTRIILPLKKQTPFSAVPAGIKHYKPEPGNPNTINSITAYCIYTDRSGTLWIGTDNGLNKLEKKKDKQSGEMIEQFTHYTRKDGLSDDEISSIMEDKHGNLWIGTSNGLSKFNPYTRRFKKYDRSDGLWTLDISGESYCSSTGEMFIATNDGVLTFYPDSIQDNTHIPAVVITDFKLFGEPVKIGENSPLKRSITTSNEIVLPFNKNTFSFEFASLSYVNPDKNLYKYMMEGLDDKWSEAGRRRFAEYHRLSPGTYTFRVIGSNNDGVWNEDEASVRIIILPPWWRTAYAYAGYGILIILLIMRYVKWKAGKLKKENIELGKMVKERTKKIKEHQKKIEAQKKLIEEKNKKIKERNRKIIKMDRIKTRFFTNISHEFRTPLTLILGPVEEIMEDQRISVKTHKKLEMVRRNTRRILDLVNQLLDISKVDSGKMMMHLKKADISKTLRMITGSFLSLAETKGIIYNRQIPSVQKQTWFDAEMLEKIIVNLLSNAFKFSPEGGVVIFKARFSDGQHTDFREILEITITDQGPGISAGSKEKIFDRFYQEENAGSKTYPGTGIGLSLVSELVSLNHGEIEVESEPGKGSTFIVRFPLGKDHLKENEYVILENKVEIDFKKTEIADESTETTVTEQEEISPDTDSEKPIILIVEDNSDIRIHISNNFEEEFQVNEAIDGSAGLKMAFETIPDLIITDLMMPKMDGIELCRRLKSDERTSHIPVIMLTAKAALDDKLKGIETGADDYITKPFQMKELKARVHNLIEQRRRLRERFSRELTLEPQDITVNSCDEEFLRRAIATVEDHMSDEQFDIKTFCREMNMSHTTLFRKLCSLTDQSPSDFIKTIRIKRASMLIKQHYGNIAKISYEVGFNNPSYFSKCFKEITGISPTEFSKK